MGSNEPEFYREDWREQKKKQHTPTHKGREEGGM
jgi:hypothetical protein